MKSLTAWFGTGSRFEVYGTEGMLMLDTGNLSNSVKRTGHAFAATIRAGRDGAPSFRDELKIHCVWDAAEKSVRDKSWATVDYSPPTAARSGAACGN